MINLINNGRTFFYFDKYGMMLERLGWGADGIGDALWRTSLALIASGNEIIALYVQSSVKIKDNKISFIRHPETNATDTSRDQSIMALVALKLHKKEAYTRITKKLNYRISEKFTWLEAWFWAKENYLIWRILSSYKFLFIRSEPSYSHHLFCWMIWSSKQSMPLFRKLMLRVVHKENYLLRALLGVKEDIPELKPKTDFIWQRDISNFEGRELTKEEAEYNTLDIDVLEAVIKLNK